MKASPVAVLAVAALIAGCGPSHVDSTYFVTKIDGTQTCLSLVHGDGDQRICDHFPKIDASRPLRPGDCVVLRLYPESSGAARLMLRPQSDCR